MLEDLQLTSFEDGPAGLILLGHDFATSSGALIERSRAREQAESDDQTEPTGGPENDEDPEQRASCTRAKALKGGGFCRVFNGKRQVAPGSLVRGSWNVQVGHHRASPVRAEARGSVLTPLVEHAGGDPSRHQHDDQ